MVKRERGERAGKNRGGLGQKEQKKGKRRKRGSKGKEESEGKDYHPHWWYNNLSALPFAENFRYFNVKMAFFLDSLVLSFFFAVTKNNF